jgi:hypothetical protein
MLQHCTKFLDKKFATRDFDAVSSCTLIGAMQSGNSLILMLRHTRRAPQAANVVTSRLFARCPLLQSFSDESYLRKVFGEFGPVVSASITRGPQGYSKGFGFIEFMRSDHAAA